MEVHRRAWPPSHGLRYDNERMPELVHRRISLLIPLFLGACGAPGPMPVRQATTAGPPKVSVTASVSSTGPVASSSADVPESPPPKRALRLPLESDRAWSPNGNGLALDGGIVDLVTKKVTPFACQYPRWVSDRYVVCETTGVLALDVEKGMVRSLPCKGNPNQIAVPDNIVRRIKVHPSGTGQINLHPCMGRSTALDCVCV